MSKPVLVFLANGTQGRAVVNAAARRGHIVRALVRTPRPIDPAIQTVAGDLDDPANLIAAAAGAAHMILQIPTAAAADMVRQAGNALAAARHAGIGSIVLKLASASRASPCAEPSFVANAAVERLVRDAGIPVAIVRPTLYLDNLLKPSAVADLRDHGILAPPIAAGQRIVWTSAADCAEAAVRLIEAGRYGGDHRIAGPESVTGDALAHRLSTALARPIAYRSQTIAAFEREVDDAMGAGMGARIASKFRYFRDHCEDADRILAGPAGATSAIPGFRPTGIAEWAARHREELLGSGPD